MGGLPGYQAGGINYCGILGVNYSETQQERQIPENSILMAMVFRMEQKRG